jgi:hypothetical protein
MKYLSLGEQQRSDPLLDGEQEGDRYMTADISPW